MKTLLELYNKHKKGDWPDKGSVHSYIEVYEELLAPYRKTAKNVLEIGLMSGESLRMWTEYFKDAVVYGVDCDVSPIGGMANLSDAIREGYNVKIADATNALEMGLHFQGIKFDVVIEDANHDIAQQLQIFDTLLPYVAEGGIYIIEDIQNIDESRQIFETINHVKEVIILDRRHIKNRYDDVLVIIKDKP
jgi:predicted O-methyltransferase YrrM